MSASLLQGLEREIEIFTDSGKKSLNNLFLDSQNFLDELYLTKASLEKSIEEEKSVTIEKSKNVDLLAKLEKSTGHWYKKSMSHLKVYNSSTSKFQKNILTNPNYNVDLDEAYTYPLNLNNFSESSVSSGIGASHASLTNIKLAKEKNQEELIKAIISHLLKIGHCDLIKDISHGLISDFSIDSELLSKFRLLNEIFDDIILRHDLSKALEWLNFKYNMTNVSVDLKDGSLPDSASEEIEFKFHVLQFTLLLNKDSIFNLNNALEAYVYSKEHFPRFFKSYLDEISPLMTLLLFKTPNENDDISQRHLLERISDLTIKMKAIFDIESDKKQRKRGESTFVGEILANFKNIHEYQSIFVNLANDFISEYCKNLNLSNDSSLFQSILAGFLNLPSFYKYNKIQLKLNKVKEIESIQLNNTNSDSNSQLLDAPYTFDLPFQLPDSNRFLFNYHPIFICPISKEQLVPITSGNIMCDEENRKRKKRSILDHAMPPTSLKNPVVVLNFCQHLALKDSVWQLSKKGTEIFKCHYCYKKHKFSDVSDAYFIDL